MNSAFDIPKRKKAFSEFAKTIHRFGPLTVNVNFTLGS